MSVTPPPIQLGPYALGRVHKAEALEALLKLPDDSVDLLLTDPPYSSGGLMRSDRSADPSEKYTQSGVKKVHPSFTGDNRDGRSWAYWTTLWLSECLRVVREGGYAMVFTDWRQLPSATDAFQSGGFVWRGVIAWDKGDSARAPHTGYFRHQCEYIVWGTRGAREPAAHGGPWPGCMRTPVRRDDKHHVTGKPTELVRQLVQCVPAGSVVLDPFAGSGTTVVGSYLEGRHAVGFEKEDAYVDIANERIRGAVGGLESSAALAGQSGLFS